MGVILLIDNFDSFTYNIVQAYQQLGREVKVARNHMITPELILKMQPHLLVIGPGPGNPKSAGVSLDCARLAEKGISIFGICLGHQAIGEAYGAQVIRSDKAIHGKTSPIFHSGIGTFKGINQGFAAVRYHSLVIDPTSVPQELEITAWTAEGDVMGICHRHLPIEGVQFHPDSIGSEDGEKFFINSLRISPIITS